MEGGILCLNLLARKGEADRRDTFSILLFPLEKKGKNTPNDTEVPGLMISSVFPRTHHTSSLGPCKANRGTRAEGGPAWDTMFPGPQARAYRRRAPHKPRDKLRKRFFPQGRQPGLWSSAFSVSCLLHGLRLLCGSCICPRPCIRVSLEPPGSGEA